MSGPKMIYLDFDTQPPLTSRHILCSTTRGAVKNAMRKMDRAGVIEGQCGIYDSHIGLGFRGYVIKRPGQDLEFEPAA